MTRDDPAPIYTIGHSTRPLEAFVDILRGAAVRRLVDVRSIPRSRTNPQYNLDSLPAALAGMQIGHEIIDALGGRRGRQKHVPPEINGYWQNQSFHNYADYAMSESFRTGLDRLIALADEAPTAIMCSEAVWWRCHRRIIADYLLHAGRPVLHLMGEGRIEPAKPTPAAVPRGDALAYPALAAQS
jgi:uncharacterized protein (DUF488 family)